jgi:hypothetical protein
MLFEHHFFRNHLFSFPILVIATIELHVHILTMLACNPSLMLVLFMGGWQDTIVVMNVLK